MENQQVYVSYTMPYHEYTMPYTLANTISTMHYAMGRLGVILPSFQQLFSILIASIFYSMV